MGLKGGILLFGGTVGISTKSADSAQSISEMHLPLTWVALGAILMLLTTWIIYCWRRSRSKRRLNSPRLLLRDLFRLHNLGWGDQRLLLQSARRQKITNPARLFLEVELWQHAMDAERSPARRRRLRSLQVKLLGD